MRKKVLTKDCPSCDEMRINDDNQFQCFWGDSQQAKILNNPKGRIKNCKLERGK